MRRSLFGEGLGTALLLYVIVSSGIAVEARADDAGLQLFIHATVVGIGLAAIIAMLQTVSGAHFNPSVTLAFWKTRSIDGSMAGLYIAAQLLGAFVGVAIANLSFGEALLSVSATERSGWGLVLAEAIATFVLVLVILALVRTNRAGAVPAAVGAWVAAAVVATSSTGFANPAVTVARTLSDTYTGIAPTSVAPFVIAQLVAGFLAALAATALFTSDLGSTSNAKEHHAR